MSVPLAILIATAAGGLLSAGIAAVFGQFARPGWVPVMVSFAIGLAVRSLLRRVA